jgi:hypothetical protein
VGNLIDPSSGKLATIVSQDPIYVIFQASERIPIIAKESEGSSALPAFARRYQGVLDPLNDSSELAKLIKAATGDWDCEVILTDEPFVGLRAMDESWANRFFGRKGRKIQETPATWRVQNWPQANPEIVAYWARLDASAKAAVRNPGTVFQCLSVAFEMRDQVLFVRLPSGRELCYPSPTIKPGKFGHAHRLPNLRQKLVAAIRPDL